MGTLYRRKASPKWYGEYTNAEGNRVQKSTGTTIKRDAQAILTKWEIDANNQRQGLAVSPSTTLETLLREYLLYTSGNSGEHQNRTENRIRRVLDGCGFTFPSDIDRIKVENIVKTFRDKHGQPIASRTQGHYLTSLKSFTRWLTDLRSALPKDPLRAVRKPNFQRDRKLTRRYLKPEEWRWLSKTPHALIYETAIVTGLRASELRSLTPASLRSDHIYLQAQHAKNGLAAKQFISADLRDRLANRLPFSLTARTAEMIRDDLAIARWLAANDDVSINDGFLQPLDPRGDSLDFHALRHTCGAWLAIAGVSIKVIQSVMRHSTITLTLDTYGHLLPGAEQDAAAKLSVFLTQPCA